MPAPMAAMRLDLSGPDSFEPSGIFNQDIWMRPDRSKRTAGALLWEFATPGLRAAGMQGGVALGAGCPAMGCTVISLQNGCSH
jgi:hypothetical protein